MSADSAGIPGGFRRGGGRGLHIHPIAIRPGVSADRPHGPLDGLPREVAHIDARAAAVFLGFHRCGPAAAFVGVGFLHVPRLRPGAADGGIGAVIPIWAAFGDDVAAVPLEGRAVAVAHLLDEGRRGLHDLVDVHLERGGLALHVVGRKHGAGAPGTLGAEVRLDDEAGVLIEVDPCDRHALSLRGRVGVAVHIGDVDYTVQPGLGIAP